MTDAKSIRDQIRDSAEKAIRRERRPLHNLAITDAVIKELPTLAHISAKTVNTCLHDDPGARFRRVGPGTWILKEFDR